MKAPKNLNHEVTKHTKNLLNGKPLRALRVFVVSLFCIAAIALAHDGRPFDSLSGRDTRNYPPDVQADIRHIALNIDMRDPMSRSFRCEETIRLCAIQPLKHLDLNAMNFKIESVTRGGGADVRYRYDDELLSLNFDPAITGTEELKIVYTVANPQAGMIFALPDEAYKDRPLMIHTQGEAETNRYWFASHDYPNERQTTEIKVTIPSNLSALSNGALVSKESVDTNFTRWHYKLSQTHVSYLVSLVIGEFAVVRDEWRGKPVEYWVPKSHEANAKRTFGRTPEMMEHFSKLIGFDYPWEKYAQSVVYNFEAGGMENTSATTLVEWTNLDERAALDSDSEGLISHELAHQWFGDLLTCRSWQHIWLNEGFATFMNHVWTEHARGRDAYAYDIWRAMQTVATNDDATARGGVSWPFYEAAEQTFGRTISNPYAKGSIVLHMLRESMGDELFWRVVGEYVKRHAFGNVETDDLRKVCDDMSGRSYERFFQQWVYRAGTPHIKVKHDWDESAKELRLTLEQTQPIGIDSPAFTGEIDVSLSSGSRYELRTIDLNSRISTFTTRLDHEPQRIAIDPRGAFLAKWDCSDLPTKTLMEVAMDRSSGFARLGAIATLAERDRDDVRTVLTTLMLDDAHPESCRIEAASALGKMHRPAARDILLDALKEGAAIKDHRVRRAAVAALGDYPRDPKVRETLLRYARHDETYGVEAVASAALGNQTVDDEIIQVLIDNAKRSSFRDQIRSSALASLGTLGDARGLDVATKLAAYGQPFRSRSSAIEAIGTIARALRDIGGSGAHVKSATDTLVALLDDPQPRNAAAAARALGTLGDSRAIPDLKRLANSAALWRVRDAARQSIAKIESKSTDSTTMKQLRDRVDALEAAAQRAERDQMTGGETKAHLQPTTAPTTAPARGH